MGETDGQGGWLTCGEAAEVLARPRRCDGGHDGTTGRTCAPICPASMPRSGCPRRPVLPGNAHPRPTSTSTLPDGQMPAVSAGTTQVGADAARAFELAIEALHEQLVGERRRVDELLASLAEERRQIDRLHLDLADAVTAERIAAGEAAALRTIVTGLRERPWWRRWFR